MNPLARAALATVSCALVWGSPPRLAGAPPRLIDVGVARIDITPDYPIRLTGYAVRTNESQGVVQRLWAKALAIGSDAQGPAVLLTADNCGVCANVVEEVAARLQRQVALPRERFAVCSSHTHTGPCTVGFAPNIFAQEIAPAEQSTIERYTRELTDKLEQVALQALAQRRPACLGWNQGRVGFAANRRTAGGPVDHAVPVLAAWDPADGQLRAVLANYACHCTTLGGDFNQLSGDWAGYAQAAIERTHPGATALIAIGCGADANPSPRHGPDGGLAWARQHGEALAAEVNELLDGHLFPLEDLPACRAKRIELPYDRHFTRAEWEARAKEPGIVGYHARRYLARLDRGDALPHALPYMVQTWTFGERLAMVFLGGEVVVDYARRLKADFDPERLWINAYANDVPCYIPSRRILEEGGYEAETSLWYYDRPARLAPAVEDLIVATVHALLPENFRAPAQLAEFPPPRSPEDSLRSMRVRPGLSVELVAAEPLVVDPVAIDWGADGNLWVVEMRDFPLGLDGRGKPGGRVKFLQDLDGDGRCDTATVFLDEIPFPTGVTAWNRGVLVCAAPDILYAQDTDGDGRADRVEKLFSGFATENYQARVNSLRLGLDNWFYGANGLLGGRIRTPAGGPAIDIRGRDFRFDPFTRAFEPAAGLTQQGRARDDWDEWFGCDNSTLLWHYPLPDHYQRRNPHVTPPEPRVAVAAAAGLDHLFPISRTLRRFNDPHRANRVTSACGLGFYRDTLLGEAFYGNAFVCEPVHNLVRRLVLEPTGVTFTARRAEDESQREFLASRDNWFRPVEVRTGPDGALWVVDFYRFVVEHPRWITADRLAELDLRAGDDKGRIYRIVPRAKSRRPVRDLTRLSARALADALETPNGTERDRVHLELLRRRDQAAARPLRRLAARSPNAAVRLQALGALDGLEALPASTLRRALADASPQVRRHAVRLAERRAAADPQWATALLDRVNDPDLVVRYQLALSLGEWTDPRAGRAAVELASRDGADPWMRAAVLSSVARWPTAFVRAWSALAPEPLARDALVDGGFQTVIGQENLPALQVALRTLFPPPGRPLTESGLRDALQLLAGLSQHPGLLDALSTSGDEAARQRLVRLQDEVAPQAARVATQADRPEALRQAAIKLVGALARESEAQRQDLLALLDAALPPALHQAVLEALRRQPAADWSGRLLAGWPTRPPARRGEILDLLVTREAWTRALLAALAEGTVSPAEVSASIRQRLLEHPAAEVRSRAQAVFAAARLADRAQVLAQFEPALRLTGDPARGAAHFAERCASCHALRGQGDAVGPNLAALTDRSAAFLLTSILDPNAAVAEPYVAYSVETKDGRSLHGLVSGETATSLTLLNAGGLRETILRTEVAAIRASNASLMPEGLEAGLTPQDLADLIAYVQHAPAPFGSATPAEVAQARAQFFAAGADGVAKILPGAEQLPYASWLGRLPLHLCRQTDGQSKLAWETAPTPAGLARDGVHTFRLAAAMGYESQPAGSFTLRVNGAPVLQFGVTRSDQTWRSADGTVRMRYTVMESNQEDSNGVLEIDVQGARLTPGQPVSFEVLGSASHSQRWFGVYQTGNRP